MRVLILNSILYTSETDAIPKVDSIKDTMIYTLCLGFLKAGHTPVLVAAEDYHPVEQEDYPFEIVFLKCRLKKLFPPRCLPYQPSLRKYLSRNKDRFDLIITSEVFSLCSLMAVCAAKEKTIIWHELGKHNQFLKKLPSKLWYNLVGRVVFRNVLIVPRSQAAYNFISGYCKNVSVICIDHGVDLSRFACSPSKKNQFIVVSQLIERKRIDGIIDRFADFQKRYDPGRVYRLYIIGDGILRDQLQRRAKALDIETSVVFTGYLSHAEMVGFLSNSQAMLVNTMRDANMVSIAESIACGTPVLTNSVPFSASYIKENVLGIVRDNWDAEDLYRIVVNNRLYSGNCGSYREKLSNIYCAKQFVQLFNKNRHSVYDRNEVK